jgi:hypothetical protein
MTFSKNVEARCICGENDLSWLLKYTFALWLGCFHPAPLSALQSKRRKEHIKKGRTLLRNQDKSKSKIDSILSRFLINRVLLLVNWKKPYDIFYVDKTPNKQLRDSPKSTSTTSILPAGSKQTFSRTDPTQTTLHILQFIVNLLTPSLALVLLLLLFILGVQSHWEESPSYHNPRFSVGPPRWFYIGYSESPYFLALVRAVLINKIKKDKIICYFFMRTHTYIHKAIMKNDVWKHIIEHVILACYFCFCAAFFEKTCDYSSVVT